MATSDTFVSSEIFGDNRIRARRVAHGWSQQELASRSGLSRPAISAIEIGRIAPSVTAALQLAAVFGCSVEVLFGITTSIGAPSFAWDCRRDATHWWAAEIDGKLMIYPFEGLEDVAVPTDGNGDVPASLDRDVLAKARQTLVVAGCDPAVGFLSRQLEARGVRLLTLRRSSNDALALLSAGKVHLAGVHFGATSGSSVNANRAGKMLGCAYRLIHYANWDEGLIGANHVALKRPNDPFRQRLRWLGRESGSGIGHMLHDFFERRPLPRRNVSSHRAVAAALQAGLADIGAGLRLTALEAGLQFLHLRTAAYDLCFVEREFDDPRIEILRSVLRETTLRAQIAGLPGYSTEGMGEMLTLPALSC